MHGHVEIKAGEMAEYARSIKEIEVVAKRVPDPRPRAQVNIIWLILHGKLDCETPSG